MEDSQNQIIVIDQDGVRGMINGSTLDFQAQTPVIITYDGDRHVQAPVEMCETFRTHHNSNYASSALGYETYEPAYQYGYTLRNSGNRSGGNWNAVEAEARNNWERDNRGTWDRFKDAIRHGWENATN